MKAQFQLNLLFLLQLLHILLFTTIFWLTGCSKKNKSKEGTPPKTPSVQLPAPSPSPTLPPPSSAAAAPTTSASETSKIKEPVEEKKEDKKDEKKEGKKSQKSKMSKMDKVGDKEEKKDDDGYEICLDMTPSQLKQIAEQGEEKKKE